jgi:pimeloyl-ACP methyl ester carboxylesterase
VKAEPLVRQHSGHRNRDTVGAVVPDLVAGPAGRARRGHDGPVWASVVVRIVVLVAALSAAGCGQRSPNPPGPSGSAPVSPTTASLSPSPVVARCGTPDAPAQTLTIRTADGVHLAAVEAGTGVRGVVLIHELGTRGLCGWWDYAAYLSGRGFNVLLFDHRCTGQSACPAGGSQGNGLMSDIEAAVGRLQADGAAKIVLLGGSQGASEALIAACLAPPGVAGVVALSADELTTPLAEPPYPQTARAAAPRLRLPALFAVAAADRYVSVEDTRALVASIGSSSKRLVELGAGAGHGWDLVAAQPNGKRPALNDTVVDFLTQATS